jgi:hypothetical protein
MAGESKLVPVVVHFRDNSKPASCFVDEALGHINGLSCCPYKDGSGLSTFYPWKNISKVEFLGNSPPPLSDSEQPSIPDNCYL